MRADQAALQALSERELGQIKISIGTSLALEGAFGILEDNPNTNPIIHKVDVIYVNVRTLCRNLVGSVPTEVAPTLFAEDLAQTLMNEMMVMDATIAQYTQGRVKSRFYIPRYRGIEKRFPKAILKKVNTDRQRFAAIREENTLDEVQGMADRFHHTLDIFEIDMDFESDNRRALLLTNYAIDLLQKYKFQSLVLLESHTGAAKSPVHWHTKLSNGKDLPRIPFDRMTVQFFGDGSNLFTAYPIKARRIMQDIAEKNKWTFATTKDYILSCVHKAYEPALETLVKDLYKL